MHLLHWKLKLLKKNLKKFLIRNTDKEKEGLNQKMEGGTSC